MDNISVNNLTITDNVFDADFLATKTLYTRSFNTLPNSHFVNSIDGERTYNAFKNKFSTFIKNEHCCRYFKHKEKTFDFGKTILVLHNKCIIEFGYGYCEILHDGSDSKFLHDVAALANKYKERQKKQPAEINIVVRSGSYLDLKEMEIKKTKLDIDLFYEDDFKAIDETIKQRLNKKNDKGIVLLHGMPGTGKTTYLRYLIGKIKKRVLFLSPNVAENLMAPEFIELLIDNPNTVVIIEDAENIIMDRRSSNSSSVSNLLNISDGLLADFLNVQLICTFNSPLTMIDSALMRKGRLIARYEFGKLSIAKAQKLSDHLKLGTTISRPMTVAEITNQHEQNFETKQVQVIGFRQHERVASNAGELALQNN